MSTGSRLGVTALLGVCLSGCASAGDPGMEGGPTLEYRLYVANESSDLVSRVVFDPDGLRVEREIPAGIFPADIDGVHGVAVSPGGEWLYVTVAHGTPDGSVWKFHAGPDTLVDRATLGRFPASIDTSNDGRLLFAVNFNLHGDPVPSTLSILYEPTLRELARLTSCVMPHGSRVNEAGTKHYHVCMHSEQLVEVDLLSLQISARYSVMPLMEGELPLDETDMDHQMSRSCSPTWVTPGTGSRADRVYVTCNAGAEVLEIDVGSWTIRRRFPTGAGPYNMDATPDGATLVVTLKGEQAIQVVDLVTGRSTRLATSKPLTHGVAVSPDGRYAFVTNESVGADPGTLDVFDLERLEIVASTELALQPGGIAIWRVDPPGQGPAR